MKQKDIALIIIIVAFSGFVSFLLSSKFISSSVSKQEAATVEPISDEFKTPSKKFFNENSINPTAEIQIEDTQNPNPFQ